MRISDVLRVKGTQVVTVTPSTTVRQLLAVLAEHRIGAVVVSHDGTAVYGIASERDIVRALARRAPRCRLSRSRPSTPPRCTRSRRRSRSRRSCA